jgi:hypothetical protein
MKNKHNKHTCIECNKMAEYDAPQYYCARHWVEWWVDGLGIKSKAAREKEIKNSIRRIRHKDKKDGMTRL